MEFLLFILLVVVIILLVRITNKFDKVNTKLEQSNRMVDGLYHLLKGVQEEIVGLKGKRVDTPPVSTEQEDAPIGAPPPIPVHRPIVTSVPPVEEEAMVLDPIQMITEQNEEAVLSTIPIIEEQAPLQEEEVRYKVNDVPKVQQESKFIQSLKEVNWLNAIGIITLVLGIGFFVKYAIDQDWINEIGRVALGIAIGGIIIGVAHKLSAKYHVFSSILMGGGFATLYTTITLAFREYEIFNQITAFSILTIITILAIFLSIAYKRQELAIFAFIGGMLAPLLVSTGGGNHIVLFSYILLLNTGVLVVAIRQKWLIIDKFSYALTFLYLFAWLFAKYKMEYQAEAILFTTLFFFQFMILLILRYTNRENEKSNWGHLIYITAVNFTILMSFFIIHESSPGTNYLGVIIIGMALVNALCIVITTRSKAISIDKNFVYTLLAITIGLVSLAIPVQLSKVYITVVWAIEMSVLLWIWTRTKANLFRVGAMLLGGFTVLSYLMDITSFIPTYQYNEVEEKSSLINLLPIVINQYTLTGIVILGAFFFLYTVLGKHSIKEEETIGLKDIPQPTSREMRTSIRIALIVLSYLVVFLEISYQVACRIEYPTSETTTGVYRYFSLVTYTVVFAAIYFALYKKQITTLSYQLFTGLSCLLLLFYTSSVASLRSEIFSYGEYPSFYFILHLLALAGLLYFYGKLYRNIAMFKQQAYRWLHAILFGSLVLLFSVELDNIVIWVSSTQDTYDVILGNVHAYGYPILWGLMAMLLMIIGMNKEKAELRKLSLLSFGIIILKFYLYDVWRMNQGGKIASFVVLGVILLVVSFLLERIKLLLKDKDQENESEVSKEGNRP